MGLKIGQRDVLLVVSASMFLIGLGIVGWLLQREIILVVLPGFCVAILLTTILEVYRRLSEDYLKLIEEYRDFRKSQESQQTQQFKHIESLFSLFSVLKPGVPLPEMGGWAASADFLKKVTETVLTEKPHLVVEASSGVSTLAIAYCLKQLGQGRVISLEHDAKYFAISQRLMEAHGLADVATIVHAPLTEFVINNQTWLWYDLACLKLDQFIDLLVIDGPPGSIQKLSRYPALPLLYQQLSNQATIMLDDGYRDDEQAIAALWDEEFKHISWEFLDLEKGAYVFYKNEPA